MSVKKSQAIPEYFIDLKSSFWFRQGSENKTMMMFCDIQNLFQGDCHVSRFPEVHLKKILSVTKHGLCLRNPNNSLELYKVLQDHSTPGGGGVLPYMGYIDMCRCEGYGFQAVYSGIGYINQSVWV